MASRAPGTPNSFIENVNALSNASSLANGDIVQDTQEARDIAVAAATDAHNSEIEAENSEDLAQEWADKGHNDPVVGTAGSNAEYSAYHWAVEASLITGDNTIDDSAPSLSKTYSSTKIEERVATRSLTSHTHASLYEPIITPKKTAFNQNFSTASGTNGSLTSVSREDHTHTNFEPTIATKNTAFNKNFGTTSGTVMEGDTNFDTNYMAKVAENTAYNKSFVVDLNNPQPEEIQRGNHTHPAEKIDYNNTGTSLGSSTVQGAITEVSGKIDNVQAAESTFITLLTQTQYTQTISAINTPTKLIMPISTIQSSKNASNNSDAEITIDYASSAYGRPAKLVEGVLSVALKISNAENFAINIAVDDVIAGSAMKGTDDLIIGQFITNLDVTDTSPGLHQAKLSIWLTNLDNAADCVIESANIVWRGNPEGAIVASGTSIDHSDLTGTGAANGVHTTSDIQNLDTDLGLKASKVGTPVLDNILLMDATGDLKDSGVASTALTGAMQLSTVKVLDNILTMTSAGQAQDSTYKVTDLALNAGDELVPFKVANSTANNEAVNQGQMNAIAATYVLDTDYQTFIARTDNPHSVTHTQAGAAATVHTHAIADTTLLQDTLDAKYVKISPTPATGNIVQVKADGQLEDGSLLATDINDSTKIALDTTNFNANLSSADDTVQKAFESLDNTAGYSDPLTTRGDLVFRNDTVTTRLAVGSNGQVLSSDGTDVSWSTPSTGGQVNTVVAGTNVTVNATDPVNPIVTSYQDTFTGDITENVAIATDAITATLGTMQHKTMTGAITVTDSLTEGQWVTVVYTPAGNVITFPTVDSSNVWLTALPTLATTNKVLYEKLNGVFYMSDAGSV